MFADHLADHLAAITGPFVVTEEAEKFIAAMHEHHPEELDAWLHERHVWCVAEEMRAHLRSERARAQAHAGTRAFAEHYSLDDTPTDDTFATRYCISEDNVWKSVAEMTGEDHTYVAGQYEVSGKRALARAAFHEVIAKRVGKKTTAQVMSAEEYDRLRREVEGL